MKNDKRDFLDVDWNVVFAQLSEGSLEEDNEIAKSHFKIALEELGYCEGTNRDQVLCNINAAGSLLKMVGLGTIKR